MPGPRTSGSRRLGTIVAGMTERHGGWWRCGRARRSNCKIPPPPLMPPIVISREVNPAAPANPGSAAGADLREWRHPALAVDEEVAEPAPDDLQVLDAAERRAGAGQLVGLVGDAHQADRLLE